MSGPAPAPSGAGHGAVAWAGSRWVGMCPLSSGNSSGARPGWAEGRGGDGVRAGSGRPPAGLRTRGQQAGGGGCLGRLWTRGNTQGCRTGGCRAHRWQRPRARSRHPLPARCHLSLGAAAAVSGGPGAVRRTPHLPAPDRAASGATEQRGARRMRLCLPGLTAQACCPLASDAGLPGPSSVLFREQAPSDPQGGSSRPTDSPGPRIPQLLRPADALTLPVGRGPFHPRPLHELSHNHKSCPKSTEACVGAARRWTPGPPPFPTLEEKAVWALIALGLFRILFLTHQRCNI